MTNVGYFFNNSIIRVEINKPFCVLYQDLYSIILLYSISFYNQTSLISDKTINFKNNPMIMVFF